MDAALYVPGRDIDQVEDYALKFDAPSCTCSALEIVYAAKRSREQQEFIHYLGKNGPSKPKDTAEGIGKKGPAVRRLLQKLFADRELKIDDGRYSLISILGNGGNSSDEDHDVDRDDTTVTFATAVSDVTGVTAPCSAAEYRAARDRNT